MKSLHVISSVSPVRGGPTHAVLQTVKALRNLGVDSQIVTTNDHGSEQLLNVSLNTKIEYQGVPTRFFSRYYPWIKKNHFNRDKAFIFSAELTRWLWHHIRDYDIIETRYLFSYPSSCARIIARRQGIPYIVHPTGQLAPWALAQSRLKKQIYSFLIERPNLNSAAAIQCSSKGEVKDVHKFGIQVPTFTVPVGVNSFVDCPEAEARHKLHHTYGIPNQKPIVLFLSRLHYKKRPDLLIQALSQLAVKSYDFHLILAGSGETDYVNHLKKLVASLGLAKHTSFAGFVTGEDKNLLLQGSDIFVLPSFSENFGVAVAEAMAAGLPVIVTPGVQISPEIAAAKAGLVVEGEIETLADAIATLLNSPHLCHELGENGKRLVSHRYSWKVIAQNLISVYTAIIEGKPLPDHLSNY
ncbi:glycosyltransferase [Coleofasciculus sp.]|uniref:glycosyltransferase n=1 Tax=Coleofasciculus sp. TaxID=3100458 RepID=UPI0039FA62F9